MCSYNLSAVEEKAGRQILARLDPSQASPFGELQVSERLCLKKQKQKQRTTPKEWHSRFSSGFPTHVHPQVNMRSPNKKSASIRIVLHIPGVGTLCICEHFWSLAQFALFHGQVASTVWSSLQPSELLPLWLSVPCGPWGLGCTHFSRFLLTCWYRTVETWRPHFRPVALARSSLLSVCQLLLCWVQVTLQACCVSSQCSLE